MAEKYLVVKGVAGLGNRLFTLGRAIDYAHRTKRVLLVDWQDGYLYPKSENFFHHYFHLKNVVHVQAWAEIPDFAPEACWPSLKRNSLMQDVYTLFEPYQPITRQYLHHRLLFNETMKRFGRYWRSVDWERKPASLLEVFAREHMSYGSDLSPHHEEQLLLFLDYCPDFSPIIFQQHLRLKPFMQERIDGYVNTHFADALTAGLHYRNTDKQPEKGLDNWLKMMEKWSIKPEQLFLATDDVHAEAKLQQYFPKVVSYPKTFPESGSKNLHHHGMQSGDEAFARQMVEASIMDMWLLSRCDYLFYQENSTFSQVSKIFHPQPEHCFDWQQFEPV